MFYVATPILLYLFYKSYYSEEHCLTMWGAVALLAVLTLTLKQSLLTWATVVVCVRVCCMIGVESILS